MKTSSWKTVLFAAGFAVLCSVLLASCGKKEENEKMSFVLTVAETSAEDDGGKEAETKPEPVDIVNGFRFEACDEMVYCTGDGVKLRRKPGMDGEVIGYMFRGKKVQRIGKNSKWSRILWEGTRIYVAAEYLSPYPPETEAPSGETETSAGETEAAGGDTEASKSASAGEERNEDQ